MVRAFLNEMLIKRCEVASYPGDFCTHFLAIAMKRRGQSG